MRGALQVAGVRLNRGLCAPTKATTSASPVASTADVRGYPPFFMPRGAGRTGMGDSSEK